MRIEYVQVDNECGEYGVVVPQTVAWKNGQMWNIDRVLHFCVSHDGEYDGIRYTVLVGDEEKYLYRVGHIWYVMV